MPTVALEISILFCAIIELVAQKPCLENDMNLQPGEKCMKFNLTSMSFCDAQEYCFSQGRKMDIQGYLADGPFGKSSICYSCWSGLHRLAMDGALKENEWLSSNPSKALNPVQIPTKVLGSGKLLVYQRTQPFSKNQFDGGSPMMASVMCEFSDRMTKNHPSVFTVGRFTMNEDTNNNESFVFENSDYEGCWNVFVKHSLMSCGMRYVGGNRINPRKSMKPIVNPYSLSAYSS